MNQKETRAGTGTKTKLVESLLTPRLGPGLYYFDQVGTGPGPGPEELLCLSDWKIQINGPQLL